MMRCFMRSRYGERVWEKDRPLLAILLIGNSRRTYVELKRHIRSAALLVGGGGIVLAILLSSWAAARVTRPVEAAGACGAGSCGGKLECAGGGFRRRRTGATGGFVQSNDHRVAGAKERLVQAERVAAWRELARRLAHELKNPLFPLQLTMENLVRARQQSPEQFEEVFPRKFENAAGGDCESEGNHWAVQRIFEDAATAIATGAVE